MFSECRARVYSADSGRKRRHTGPGTLRRRQQSRVQILDLSLFPSPRYAPFSPLFPVVNIHRTIGSIRLFAGRSETLPRALCSLTVVGTRGVALASWVERTRGPARGHGRRRSIRRASSNAAPRSSQTAGCCPLATASTSEYTPKNTIAIAANPLLLTFLAAVAKILALTASSFASGAKY